MAKLLHCLWPTGPLLFVPEPCLPHCQEANFYQRWACEGECHVHLENQREFIATSRNSPLPDVLAERASHVTICSVEEACLFTLLPVQGIKLELFIFDPFYTASNVLLFEVDRADHFAGVKVGGFAPTSSGHRHPVLID